MLFTLEALPAEEGDSLLLHWKKGKEKRVALIDGGPGRVYENDLLPRLEQLAAKFPKRPVPLEFVMVSHMDSDHIVGIKKLLGALRKQLDPGTPAEKRIVSARRVWLNVFNDVLGDKVDQYYTTLTKTVEANANGRPSTEVKKRLEEKFEEKKNVEPDKIEFHAQNIAAVLAGHGEGRSVRDDHRALFDAGETDTLNAPFEGAGGGATLITLEKTPKAIDLEGLKIRIAGPSNAEIDALQKEFDKYIKEKGLTVEAVLAAYADESVKNLSSIVCLVEMGKGAAKKSMLLTGDARGDLILNGLKKQKLLKGGKLEVNILKVPHHGSDNNVEREFFDQIIADTYVLSGDGVHGNPERDTIEWIVDSRGKNAKFDIVLTYDVAHIDKNRKEDLEKKKKKWNKAKMSLEAFFAEKKAEKYKFRVLTGARKIDLGDEKVDY